MPTDDRTRAHGDFQTPDPLAARVVEALRRRGVAPRGILEPTVGRGSLLLAALRAFPGCRRALGIEMNRGYANDARRRVVAAHPLVDVEIRCLDVFRVDIGAVLEELPRPRCVLGNPPWVTGATLGTLGRAGLERRPPRVRQDDLRGLDAATGKGNFDVSEWILRALIDALHATGGGVLGTLCKASVARKLVRGAHRRGIALRSCTLHAIDAHAAFGAAVDAVLLTCDVAPPGTPDGNPGCAVFASLEDERPVRSWVVDEAGALVEKRGKGDRPSDRLVAATPHPPGQGDGWRSGVKHDCAAVMELARVDGRWRNGLGERVDIENECLFPLLKSADLAAGRVDVPRRWVIVPQRNLGEETDSLRARAPKTWRYLHAHRRLFERRASTIYRGKPPFSVFGVGDYTFARWKVAIAGLYKSLHFCVVAPISSKPVIFDDTCYFLPRASAHEAHVTLALLSSEPARQFFDARVWWGAKRPITKDLLQRLDLARLAALVTIDHSNLPRSESWSIGGAE